MAANLKRPAGVLSDWQITISYIDVLLPGPERAAALREQYRFECSCRRCAAEKAAA